MRKKEDKYLSLIHIFRQELEKGMLSLDDLKACVSHSIHIILQSVAYEETQPYGKLMEK